MNQKQKRPVEDVEDEASSSSLCVLSGLARPFPEDVCGERCKIPPGHPPRLWKPSPRHLRRRISELKAIIETGCSGGARGQGVRDLCTDDISVLTM